MPYFFYFSLYFLIVLELWSFKIHSEQDVILPILFSLILGNFGSGIGSLFIFTRWVILLNLFLAVLWCAIVVLPTAITFNYDNITEPLEWMNVIDGEV